MDQQADEAIRDVVRQWELAWNAGDMSAAAGLFCDDADFVSQGHWLIRSAQNTNIPTELAHAA